jgi:predicted AlkP superfamily pyrophosphatase or phosphodiesterase
MSIGHGPRRFALPVLVVMGLALPGGVPAPQPVLAALSDDPAAAACSLPHDELVRIWRGIKPGRSGEIVIVPKAPNYVSGGLSHDGPWDHVQEVPIFLYGPGQIEATGSVARPVTMATVAPTIAALLDFDFSTPDGHPLHEALPPPGERPEPPRLVLMVVWDGGGDNTLSRWPGAWPNLKALMEDGTWYANATVGSLSSVTDPIHATLGTGRFPMRHGLVEAAVRSAGGKVVSPWSLGPKLLIGPTLADLFDQANDNDPLVGALASESRHLSMMGHGTLRKGGDADIAVTHTGTSGWDWNLPKPSAPYFRFPAYVDQVGGWEADVRALDQQDGRLDGRWRTRVIEGLDDGFATPARLPFQTRVLEEILEREGFGADEVPDLFFLNYKLIDGTSHRFGMNSLEEKDSVQWTDAQLPALIDMLDEHVGQGKWVLVLTADHGVNPQNPSAFPIGLERLGADLRAVFDDGDGVAAIQRIRPTQIWLNVDELQANGHTVASVARYLNRYMKANNGGSSSERVFAAAFPSSILPSLACLPEAQG